MFKRILVPLDGSEIGEAALPYIKEFTKKLIRSCPPLVAISTHGHSGVRRWISGSVAYKVIQAGNTPVLLVRTPGVEA